MTTPMPDPLHYDEQTLFKVRHALVSGGVTDAQALDLITAMQNAGILFRERPRETAPEGPKP